MSLSQHLTHSFGKDEVQPKWFLIDADGKTLGRIASQIARILRGKHKPMFTTNTDTGDFVVVINAEKVKVKGRRNELKTYFSYSGYPGGAKTKKFKTLLKENPEKLVTHAVKGMIPHNRLGADIIKKLKVYTGGEHPHAAQQPETISF